MTRFRYARNVRYSCLRCGDGCRTWNVPLGPGERDVLEQLDWRDREDDLVGAEPAQHLAPPGQTARWCLRRHDDGRCIYLGEDNLCRIHKHFGARSKPLMCRLYPFGFYPMGGEIGVDVSFTCRAVAQGHGDPLSLEEPEWTKLLTQSTTEATDNRRHELRPGVALDGNLVWEIEHYLLGFLEDEDVHLFNRVRAALQFLRIGLTGDPTAPTADALRQAMAKGIPLQMAREPSGASMDKTQRAIFFQWLFLHLNPPPHDVHSLPREAFEAERSRRLKAGERYLKRKGRPWIDDRDLRADFRQIAKVQGDIFDRPETARPLAIYLRAKILGQRFLVVGNEELPLVEAAQKFFLVVPMTVWTSKALAADRGASRVEEEDVRAAVRLVDRTLGTLPTTALPEEQAEACQFIMLETDLVEAATVDVVQGRC